MVAEVQDVVKTNLVLVGVGLLSELEDFKSFSDAVGTDVVVSGGGIILEMPTSIPEPGRTLSLNRDRIVLDLAVSRSVISREYPAYHDLGRLAEVAGYAITRTSSKKPLRAFGYNIELVYNQTSEGSALEYLGKGLFSPDLQGNVGWKLLGGAGRLIFEENGARWLATIEPRFNDDSSSRVFLSLNLHRSDPGYPEESEIEASLQQVWDQAHSFVELLDARVS